MRSQKKLNPEEELKNTCLVEVHKSKHQSKGFLTNIKVETTQDSQSNVTTG